MEQLCLGGRESLRRGRVLGSCVRASWESFPRPWEYPARLQEGFEGLWLP